MSSSAPTPLRDSPCDPLLLIEEMQHRVANEYTIAIASINFIARGCDEHTRFILAGASQRLRNFATVHRAMQPPRNNDRLDLCRYLRELCLALTRAHLAERGVSLTLCEAPVALEARRAWRVGLILSELITNAVRHGNWPAHGGHIEIEVRPGIRHIQCLVSDNGMGASGASAGRGTRILEALAHELGGQMHRTFSDAGANIVLTFPRDPADWAIAANGDPTDSVTRASD